MIAFPPDGLVLTACLAAGLPAGVAAAWASRRLEGPGSQVSRVAVVVAVILVFAWAGLAAPPALVLSASLALGWTLVCLGAIDLVSLRLPDALTLPLLGLGLAVAWALPGRPVADHLVGAALGWGLLTLTGALFRRWRGVEGIGAGDAKLLAAAGAWLGWAALPSVLLIACLAALAGVAAVTSARRLSAAGNPIPFGPALCLGFWIVWLHGPLTLTSV